MKLFYCIFNIISGQYEKFYSAKEAEDFVNKNNNKYLKHQIMLGLDRGDSFSIAHLPDEYISYKNDKIVLAEIEN